MTNVFGIDVSHHNGVIDWAQVKTSGVKFAILKCIYEAQSHRIDERFEANYKGATDNGILTGVYIFIASASIKDPEGDAKALLKHLKGRALPLGIWLDYESGVLRCIGKERIRDLTYIYADIFKAAGYNVGIYCNKDWYDNVIHADLKRDFKFWLARYPRNDAGQYNDNSSLKPKMSGCVAWQYSSKGNVPGIKTKCDLNVDFGTLCQIGAKKSLEEIAAEVWADKWGKGEERKTRLIAAGYDYEAVRKIVNATKPC